MVKNVTPFDATEEFVRNLGVLTYCNDNGSGTGDGSHYGYGQPNYLHKWGNGPDYHLRGFTYTGYEPTGHGFAWSENEELAEWIALVNAESGG